jgi:hypothetical protein
LTAAGFAAAGGGGIDAAGASGFAAAGAAADGADSAARAAGGAGVAATGAAGAAAGGGAAGAAGVAVTSDAGGLAAGAGMIAFTACWQPEESLATLSFRHCSASFPPLGTPEQFAMKSERQFERIALCWSEVGSCAAAMPAPPAKQAISNTTQTAARIGVLFKDFMWLLVLLDSFLGVV